MSMVVATCVLGWTMHLLDLLWTVDRGLWTVTGPWTVTDRGTFSSTPLAELNTSFVGTQILFQKNRQTV